MVLIKKKADGTYILPPAIETAGFTLDDRHMRQLLDFLSENISELVNDEDYDFTELKGGLSRLTKRYCKKHLDRRPLIIPVVTEI